MSLILLTFGLLILIVLAMAVGVLVQKKSMASSCGGLGSMGIDKVCDCDDPCDKRKKRLAREQVWKDNQIL
ncbi:(Na+)-NQR maturation NqrM [Pseudoalteromonas xiamenensis]|uniref:(Na+)-NQR maturation NqrM n=1 Tax=Pseudoalteromonas xiamenensis TaxID=882626 RepID=UPI0027E523A2|nr:(Na+)-NQR maturation NqrM [Pseudoalteromonas xiamenensis]WMN59183.1 (Na+)-NQR maturation NqrM [Pseudoalteromonas xiamenensis]